MASLLFWSKPEIPSKTTAAPDDRRRTVSLSCLSLPTGTALPESLATGTTTSTRTRASAEAQANSLISSYGSEISRFSFLGLHSHHAILALSRLRAVPTPVRQRAPDRCESCPTRCARRHLHSQHPKQRRVALGDSLQELAWHRISDTF